MEQERRSLFDDEDIFFKQSETPLTRIEKSDEEMSNSERKARIHHIINQKYPESSEIINKFINYLLVKNLKIVLSENEIYTISQGSLGYFPKVFLDFLFQNSESENESKKNVLEIPLEAFWFSVAELSRIYQIIQMDTNLKGRSNEKKVEEGLTNYDLLRKESIALFYELKKPVKPYLLIDKDLLIKVRNGDIGSIYAVHGFLLEKTTKKNFQSSPLVELGVIFTTVKIKGVKPHMNTIHTNDFGRLLFEALRGYVIVEQ